MSSPRTMTSPTMIFIACTSSDFWQYRKALREGQTGALPLLGVRAKIRFLTSVAERCESGRIDMLGKHASRQRDRGFESHPLRHTHSNEC